MPHSSKDQILICVNGLLNGGKSLVFDLIRKEEDFIYLELSKHHYHFYKERMINQIGEKNILMIEPFIESEEIVYSNKIFAREIGSIMRKFPNYNFVIKPVDDIISLKHYKKNKEWFLYIKKYMPVKEENIHYLFVVRHPKLSWITSFNISLNDFIDSCSFDLNSRLEHTQLVKIEELEKNELLKTIIKKTDLSRVRPYTDFDFYKTKEKKFDNIDEEMSKIEKVAMDNYKLLGYDLENENVRLFMKERMNFYSGKGEY